MSNIWKFLFRKQNAETISNSDLSTDQEKGFAYGSFPTQKRSRLHFRCQTMSPELLRFLQESLFCSASESQLLSSGFTKCVDYPELEGHLYYEGYFHSLDFNKSILSLNPRTGVEFAKPCCSKELFAYFSAFKLLNAPFATHLVEALIQTNHPCGLLFADYIQKGYLFSDLAIQIHYGDAVPDDQIGWHNDGTNSWVHLATTIRGDRKLHYHTWSKQCDQKYSDHDTHCDEMHPGSVYLTSPTFFPHCPQYPQIDDYSNRVIAIQARILFTVDELLALQKSYVETINPSEVLVMISTCISQCMHDYPFVIPTLDEVMLEYNKL